MAERIHLHTVIRKPNLRGDTLQREIMDERMEGKRGREKPTEKLLDLLMKDGYGELTRKA